MKNHCLCGCVFGLVVLLAAHGSVAVDLPEDAQVLDGFETGKIGDVIAEYDFCYKYVRGYQLLRLRDLYSDTRFALEAWHLADGIEKVPENRLKDYFNLLTYAQLRSDLKYGSALRIARMTYGKWQDPRARLLEGWCLWNMSTSLRRTVVKTNEGKAVEQDRPGDYPGEGPVTDDERRQWYLESRAILSELLGKQGEAGGDALVYYVAGGVWSSPPFPDLADPEKAAGYFAEYVRRAPALHSNFLSRAWAADRANKLANRKLVDTDLFDTDDHIIRCIRERSLSGQLISQAAAVQSLKTLIQNHPPVSLWLDGGEIRLGLSQDAAPVDAGDLQTAAERLRMKVVQGADRDEIVLQRTGATDDGLSDPLVQNRVVRQLGTPTPADPDAAERDLRGLAGGLRLAESLRIENIGKRRQYRLFDATELRLRYTAPDQTHFGFVQGIVERNPLLIPGSQILKLQPDGTYGVEMQVFVLDLFDPGPL